MKVPFCQTSLGREETRAIAKVIRSGWVVQGKITQEFEEQFAQYVGGKNAIFVDSCTSALDLSIKWLLHQGLWKVGEKINVPSLTFTATVEVLVHNGLIPNFIDVDKDTLCITLLNDFKVLPVNLLGIHANCDTYIYDSAHRIMRNDVGGGNALWCYSFYATKNMTTVQGGMIVTNDLESAQWLRKARDHGVTKGTTERYKDGAWQYDVEFVGWREKSDDIHAAIGIEQLKKLDIMNSIRQEIIDKYNKAFGLKRTGLHLYPVLVSDRNLFINTLKEAGIQCSVHFLPLHRMTAYKQYAENVQLPVTEYVGEHLVSLPLYPKMSYEQVNYVIEQTLKTNLLIQE